MYFFERRKRLLRDQGRYSMYLSKEDIQFYLPKPSQVNRKIKREKKQCKNEQFNLNTYYQHDGWMD